MSDLLQRLRRVESGSERTGGEATNWYRNPDGPAAADEIERLRGLLWDALEIGGLANDLVRDRIVHGLAGLPKQSEGEIRTVQPSAALDGPCDKCGGTGYYVAPRAADKPATPQPSAAPCRIYEYDGAFKCLTHNRQWGAISPATEPCPRWTADNGSA